VNYEPRIHIVLYQPEIPHKTVSVGRMWAATAAKLWLVRPLGFQIDDRHLRRAGLDYWPHLEWEAVEDWQTLQQRLPASTTWHYFSKKATQSYTQATFTEGDALVFGRESEGLPDTMMEENSDRLWRIPMRPQVRSLNLASSVAIVTYEALRQWDA